MTAVPTGWCPNGCGYTLSRGRPNYDCPGCGRDAQAVARYTGAADARNNRPRQVDLADRSDIGAAYHRGYDQPDAWRYER